MLFVKFGACNRMCSIGWDLETFDHVYSNVTCIRTDDSHFKNDHHQSTPSQKKEKKRKEITPHALQIRIGNQHSSEEH